MKRLLQLGFLLGLGGVLAAAYFVPWFDYPRYRSAATVVQNGGRLEQFLVRLPADRIGAGIELPGEAGGARLEHFKLRDTEGNVIGVAARHSLALAGGEHAGWVLTIPSRGTIALAADVPASTSVESMLAARGIVAGRSLEPELSIDAGGPARSVAVTGEFDGLEFELVETWLVSGLESDGEIRGTLQLSTVGRRRT